MHFNLITKKYIEESAKLNEFTCVYTHIPQSDDIFEVRGKMFTVVSVKGPEGLNAVTAVNSFLDNLEAVFFTTEIVGIPTILEKAVKTALFAVNEYFESTGIVDDIIFDFGCAVIKEDILYIAKVEESYIYIVRDNKVLDLGRSLHDISNPKLVEHGSGILQVGDKVVLANTVAENLISDWALLSRYSEGEINRLITPAGDEQDKMSFLVVEIENEELPAPPAAAVKTEMGQVEEEEVHEPDSLHFPIEEEPITPLVEPMAEEGKVKGVSSKVLDMGDNIADKLIQYVKLGILKIKEGGKYVYDNRENIKAFILTKMLLIAAFLKSLKEKYIDKKKGPNFQDKNFYSNELSKNNAKGVKNLVSGLKQSNGISERRKQVSKIRKDKRYIVPVAIIGLVFFFIVFSHIKASVDYSTRSKDFASLKTKIQADITNASAALGASQVDNLYQDANGLIAQAYKLNVNNVEIDGFKSQMQQIDDNAHKIIREDKPILMSDLSLSFPGVKPNTLAQVGDNLLVTSSATNTVFSVSSTSPSSGNKLNSDLVSSPIAICSIDANSAVVYDKNNGVLKIDGSSNVTQIPGLTDIKNVVGLASFQGNLYFLDSSDQVIYKSVPVGDGYSVASNYINDNNLSDAESLAVDGNVFVVSPTLGVTRYYAGSPTPFKMGGGDSIGKPLGPLTFVFDNKYLTNLYILDPQNSRVIVLQKPDSSSVSYDLVRQYVFPNQSSITSMSIDNAEKNMYLLSGSKVLKVAL